MNPDSVTNLPAGKAGRAGAPSEEDESVISSGQQSGKPHKTSAVAVVTKPAAASSAAAASHVVRVGVRSHAVLLYERGSFSGNQSLVDYRWTQNVSREFLFHLSSWCLLFKQLVGTTG